MSVSEDKREPDTQSLTDVPVVDSDSAQESPSQHGYSKSE